MDKKDIDFNIRFIRIVLLITLIAVALTIVLTLYVLNNVNEENRTGFMMLVIFGIALLTWIATHITSVRLCKQLGNSRFEKTIEVRNIENADDTIKNLLSQRKYKKVLYNNSEEVYLKNKPFSLIGGRRCKRYIKYSIKENTIYIEAWVKTKGTELGLDHNFMARDFKIDLAMDINYIFNEKNFN